LTACYARLVEIFKDHPKREELVELAMKKILDNTDGASVDELHYLGAVIKKALRALEAAGLLDLKALTKNRMQHLNFMGQANVLCDFEGIQVNLTEAGKKKESEINRMIEHLTEIKFFTNIRDLDIQQNKDCQMRLIVVIHAFKNEMIDVFGIENLNKLKLLGLPVHIVITHLSDAFEKAPLPYMSTQLSESMFKLLNQVTTNCQKEDVLKRWLHGLWVLLLKNQFKPSSGSGTGLQHLYKWKEKKEWKPIILEVNGETIALLEKLRSKGFEDDKNWKFVNDQDKKFVCFPFPEICINLIHKSNKKSKK
jgi:hypothetical protein